MPEYLAPGVFVEETSYRTKSIEGVATSTTGFVGQCRYGPVRGKPKLVTSYEQFRRKFGGLESLEVDDKRRTNYLAFAVKGFFENGGQRCYISRLFGEMSEDLPADDELYNNDVDAHVAEAKWFKDDQGNDTYGRFRARYPGKAGNGEVTLTGRRDRNRLRDNADGERVVTGLQPGDVVELVPDSLSYESKAEVIDESSSDPEDTLDDSYLGYVDADGDLVRVDLGAGDASEVDLSTYEAVQKVTIDVEIRTGMGSEHYSDLSTHHNSPRYIGRVLRTEHPEKDVSPPYESNAAVWFETDKDGVETETGPVELLLALVDPSDKQTKLIGGSDGESLKTADLTGAESEDYYIYGLEALGEREDIAIVAAPGLAQLDEFKGQKVRDALIGHCELDQYRIAILSSAKGLDVGAVRDRRAKHDSKYAAFYYPWVVIDDPFGQRGDTIALPPDGYIAGIYARSDIERGVHKAPANEVVRGIRGFEREVTRGEQEVLNPEGINCLRTFERRGHLVWGARTISSDSEWKYVNVRRLFIYLEHSIERDTKWAIFEPNNEDLWIKIRMSIEAFLRNEQRKGAIMGRDPDEGFFVRCDRRTMTQNDLDNGRLICEVGIAPTYPAEFVIFRIGQWTADADQ